NKIYEIRGERVMLDFDLAEMYKVETKNLKKAVRRNIKRFPLDFMFELTNIEWNSLIISLRFQNGTTNQTKNRAMPFAFTEQGVAMIASVLHSDIAIEVNIGIMRAFVAMRRYLLSATTQNKEIAQVKEEIKELKEYIEEVFADYNDINEDTAMQMELINQTLAELSTKQKTVAQLQNRDKIGFKK
ncbi:MAG: ORF6N domain-containing protein, partial [Bacteroidales bacterium]